LCSITFRDTHVAMIGRRSRVSAVVAASVFVISMLFACEKAGPKSSGPLGGADVELLRQIPSGNVALFGGNYMKMQDFMNSSLGKGVMGLMEKQAKATGSELQGDMHAYMACFADLNSLRVVGGVSLDGGLAMRMAMGGVTLNQIQACAEKGKQKTTLDPDGKYLSIEVYAPGGALPSTAGYLALPTGAITMRVNMGLPSLGGAPKIGVASRADLEADAASAAKSSAADDSALISQLDRLDRTKTVWFAGSGKGTPLASKLGTVSGTMDLSKGLAIDVTVQLTDASLASKIDKSMAQLEQMKDRIPADYRSVIDGIKYDKDGDQLHFAASMSDAQIGTLMKQMAGMTAMRMH
jgi:hypothetical protein